MITAAFGTLYYTGRLDSELLVPPSSEPQTAPPSSREKPAREEPREDPKPLGKTSSRSSPQPEALTGIRLQLGSFAKAEQAHAAWQHLANHHDDLLGGTRHSVIDADLGGNKRYRVYAGPYDDMRAAVSVCETLKQRRADCLLLRRPDAVGK